MILFPFSVAPHTYFRILNKPVEKERFLNSDSYEPAFVYDQELNSALIAQRLQRVAGDIPATQALELVRASALLQKTGSAKELRRFRALNTEIYGQPQSDYMKIILGRVHSMVRPATEVIWGEVVERLGNIDAAHKTIGPSHEVFLSYQQYFKKYSGDAISKKKLPLPEMLKHMLHHLGFDQRGWRVVQVPDASHARINHQEKIIAVGHNYIVRNSKAPLRIAVHEVYGHALRGPQISIEESEGFAILLEQLLDDRFVVRRSYRYLAAGLGWGTLSTPMTFREVFEILWRVMAIATTYTVDESRCYAFDECVRIFRGGRPELPGAVYLKDSIYFAANIAMWDRLSHDRLRYNDFIDVIEGRRRILQ